MGTIKRHARVAYTAVLPQVRDYSCEEYSVGEGLDCGLCRTPALSVIHSAATI